MIALVDGDVLVYRVGFASDNQTEVQNCINCDLVMKDILNAVQATSYKVYLSDSLENNYRFKIDNNYKANRQNAPRPVHYKALRLFLQQEYKAEISLGQEADDALGIHQTAERDAARSRTDNVLIEKTSVICSIDKDLLQVPGMHYNLARGEHLEVREPDGIRSFYKQMLIGDTVDNIKGAAGIGKIKAGRLLDGVEHEAQMFKVVREVYGDDDRLLRNGQLLWVRRKENQLWEFPNVEKERVSERSDEGTS